MGAFLSFFISPKCATGHTPTGFLSLKPRTVAPYLVKRQVLSLLHRFWMRHANKSVLQTVRAIIITLKCAWLRFYVVTPWIGFSMGQCIRSISIAYIFTPNLPHSSTHCDNMQLLLCGGENVAIFNILTFSELVFLYLHLVSGFPVTWTIDSKISL